MAGGIGLRGGRLGRPSGRERGRGHSRGRRGRGSRRCQSQPPASPSPPSSPDPVAIDLSGFKFGVTIHQGMSWDKLHTSIVDGQEPHHVLQEPHNVLLRVSGGAIGLWPAEVMFDGEGQMFLHNGCRRFARSHAIDVGHFVVFKYDGHDNFSVKVFGETMCRCHYHSEED